MKDEIKKILDEFMNFDFNSQGERIEINEYERNILKDYITNLQQENGKNIEMLNDIIKEQDMKLNDLQQENEKLKLEIERLNDVLVHKPDEKIMLKTNDGKELFIIQSERIDMQEELNKANMQLMAQLEDYKSRIEKAVEYIKKETKDMPVNGCRIRLNEVLNILNGKE